ncbi:hypothetical protein AAVH_31558 [Aphelenchoides avenae]|nr:hypothetical protein AAVH_31558 [Aphelenchus avenae]
MPCCSHLHPAAADVPVRQADEAADHTKYGDDTYDGRSYNDPNHGGIDDEAHNSNHTHDTDDGGNSDNVFDTHHRNEHRNDTNKTLTPDDISLYPKHILYCHNANYDANVDATARAHLRGHCSQLPRERTHVRKQ